MGKYKVRIIEKYAYQIDVEAKNQKEAILKAKNIYENYEEPIDGYYYLFTADAYSHVDTKFIVEKAEGMK